MIYVIEKLRLFLSLLSISCFFVSANGGRIPESMIPSDSAQPDNIAPQIYDLDILPEAQSASPFNSKRGIFGQSPPSQDPILQDLLGTDSHKEWLTGLESTASELLTQFSGFAPYLAKLIKPILKTASYVMETGRNYVVEYVRNLSPETVQRIQVNVLELIKKLVNMNLVRAIMRFILQAVL